MVKLPKTILGVDSQPSWIRLHDDDDDDDDDVDDDDDADHSYI